MLRLKVTFHYSSAHTTITTIQSLKLQPGHHYVLLQPQPHTLVSPSNIVTKNYKKVKLIT